MPLSWPEIKSRAIAFSAEWKGETSERAEAKSFLNDFFQVFGIKRRRVATFETKVRKIGGRVGFIDLLWKGTLLVEFKSADKDLDRAYAQAADYFPGIKERDLPRYILVCNFERFRLYDLDTDERIEFGLTDLHRHIQRFGFIAGYTVHAIVPQDPVNIEAAEQMGRLHDLLKASGYRGHRLEVLLVRLLFCLFADNTGIFNPVQSFRDWIENFTSEDGSDLGRGLAELFQVLNTAEEDRQEAQRDAFTSFPYVNGRLFEEALPIAHFDLKMRETLLDCCALDWSAISPAIFGALFQSIMDADARRNLGAHYTSEENILKVIKPLFLDELKEEFQRIKNNRSKLLEFHEKLRNLTFLDPACGCGNFLVISYRELRLIELGVLRALQRDTKSDTIFEARSYITIDVDQFYGIEIEEFPCQVAQVAMWLVDHQMNLQVSQEFGKYFARIPLASTPHIVHGSALSTPWGSVLAPERCSYVLGNPPFVGKQHQSARQKAEFGSVMSAIPGSGVLDFVAAWYVTAASYAKDTKCHCAFVSTNSVTQGEQVGVLWAWLLAHGIKIHFAHRTFQWSNEGRGMAGVHCVIIGFGSFDVSRKIIFDYDDVDGTPHAAAARNINPYLVDAPDVVLSSRTYPISDVPRLVFGSMPNDGGYLLMNDDEKKELVAEEPAAAPYVRPFFGADEFINNLKRWCLWLPDAPPNELRNWPAVQARVKGVKTHRLGSARKTTRDLAASPTLFGEIRQPSSKYVLIPCHSSERRRFIPIGFMSPKAIAGNANLCMPNATLYHFAILTSTMHNAWVRYTCGRLESRYRYSAGIVFNNFPWPLEPTERQRDRVEKAAQEVLDARAKYPAASLADLYDPNMMPAALSKAHKQLDAAVDALYARGNFKNDGDRVAFLFERYQEIAGELIRPPAVAKRRARAPARASA